MIIVEASCVLGKISDVIEDVIIPSIEEPYARSQGYSAVELLRDMASIWGSFTELYIRDNQGLVRILRRYRELMGGQGIRYKKSNIWATLKNIDLKTRDYKKARSDNIRLRASLNAALIELNKLQTKGPAANLRNAIRRHLKEQLSREMSLRLECHAALGRLSKA